MRIERYHPGTLVLYLAAMLVFTFWFQQPVFLFLSLLSAVLVTGTIVPTGFHKTIGVAVTAGTVVFLWFALFCRMGETVLWERFLGNPVTAEGLLYSGTLWMRVTAGVFWCTCLFRLVSAQQIIQLLGRILPHFSLYLTILLCLVPRMTVQRRGIRSARECLGIPYRGREVLRIESMVVTWALDSLGMTTRSMRGRGYALRHRTTYADRLLGHGDRMLLIGQCWGMVVLLCGWALNQTQTWYAPVFLMNKITLLSMLFYGIYLLFALLPLELELISVVQRQQDRRKRGKL